MYSNNQYWGLPYAELDDLAFEKKALYQDAWRCGRYSEARRHENDLALIMDALRAYGNDL